MNDKKTFLIGFLGGIIITLVLVLLLKGGGASLRTSEQDRILARVGTEALRESEIRDKVGMYLVPIENDEYRTLSGAVEEWVNSRLLYRDAKEKGTDVPALFQKEIWSQVKTQDRHLRDAEFSKVMEQYLKTLKEKYKVNIYLKKPESYVEGLGKVPSPTPNPSASPTPLPTTAPSGPQGSVVEEKRVSFDDLEGKPAQGPADAPITLVEFSDFHCPFCARVAPTLEMLMKNYPGKIRRIWRHYPLPMHAGAEKTHEASQCAADQGKFWEYHKRLFETPDSPRNEASLSALATEIGLDIPKFSTCLSGGKYRDLIQQEVEKGKQYGVSGTPAFFINGKEISGAQPYTNFEYEVENILNPGKLPPRPSLPSAAQPPSVPPPPQKVDFTDLEGRPSLGPEDASITLVEFSDFHCPFCARVSPTLQQLMDKYSGKIRRIWKHYPLPFHTGAERTHEASECAHEQGKFWSFHQKLFASSNPQHSEQEIFQIAKDVDLNEKKFRQCLESGRAKEVVQKDMAAGNQAGVTGTPAVFVNGELVSGAQPLENFDRVIQKSLEKS